ncbi:type IV pilin protein [Lysobacter niabensis]|uniref:type IV pilin protein n=1 Tax=Agrilutibacter niabensis TaxID=380628 RepID=UPI00361DC399
MRQKGFTLIELMIVVAVVAILAAIAIPNYLEQSRKGRRADALRSVGDMQLALERWRSENPSYADCGGGGCGSGTYPTVPTSPYYTITVNATASTYTITATATGAQSGDRCGNLSATVGGKPDWSGDADCDH